MNDRQKREARWVLSTFAEAVVYQERYSGSKIRTPSSPDEVLLVMFLRDAPIIDVIDKGKLPHDIYTELPCPSDRSFLAVVEADPAFMSDAADEDGEIDVSFPVVLELTHDILNRWVEAKREQIEATRQENEREGGFTIIDTSILEDDEEGDQQWGSIPDAM